eukprot:gene9063-18774_t
MGHLSTGCITISARSSNINYHLHQLSRYLLQSLQVLRGQLESIMKIILALFVCGVFSVANSESTFNFEISLRVTENIQSFLSEIANVASLPYAMIDNNVVNVTDFYHGPPFLPGSRMFINIKKMYMVQLNVLNLGFENKLYYAMINDKTFPEGIEMDASNMTFKTSVNGYYIQKNGLPKNYKYGQAVPGLFSFPFDCTERPWYNQAKVFGSRLWTTPFMQSFPTLPTIAISNPIYRDGMLLGVVSANVLLGQISDYL